MSSSSVGGRGAQIAVRRAVAQTRLDMQGGFDVQTWFGSYAITVADPRVTLPYCFRAFGPASSSNMAAQAAAHHPSPPCDARSSLQAHLALLETNLAALHALWCARGQIQVKELEKLESCLCGAKKTCGSGMDSG
ncbi:hypothetical protein DM02DRAFT_655823 [Periconia macrospinosa]|uniref:Uncharacterized protein n=1 Tax=Periconia macrospinosa TaxID=97972 RepID=A0A2V1DRZ0_9PLEO|nr:hypothetical protein DM02DRAFT_655823 [Periconia macrospinosa]